MNLTPNDLAARYRNLLITIAREARNLRVEVQQLQSKRHDTARAGIRAGLSTIIKARNKQRAKMLQLLSRNNAANHEFFGTAKPEDIAEQEIILHPTNGAANSSQPDAPSINNARKE